MWHIWVFLDMKDMWDNAMYVICRICDLSGICEICEICEIIEICDMGPVEYLRYDIY